MLSCLGTATDLLDVPKQPTCPEREIIGHVTSPTPTHVAFLCARERSRSSLRFYSSVSRAVSRLNRLLVVSSAAQCVNYRRWHENGVARTRTRVAYVHRRGTSCRRKNWGDDLFRREKPLDVRARSRLFFARAPGRGQCMGLVEFPVSTVQPNNTVAAEVWQRNTTFFHSSFVGKSRARWLSSRLPARAQTGLQLLVQFPVTTVHTCRLRRNVQQSHMLCLSALLPGRDHYSISHGPGKLEGISTVNSYTKM